MKVSEAMGTLSSDASDGDRTRTRLVSTSTKAEKLLTLVCLGGFGLYFLILAFRYITMFPLIEYRQWVFHGQYDTLLSSDTFWRLLDLKKTLGDMAFSRDFSLWIAGLFGHVCGPVPTCHNSLHLGLLLASVALIALSVHALSLTRSWFPSVAAAILVLLSIPVFDALTWQATLLDKMAIFLTSLTIFIASKIKIVDVKTPGIVVTNVVLLCLIVAAYNAKEAAFFLGPAMCLLIGCRALIAGLGLAAAVRRTLSLTALPLIYACFYVALVYHDRTSLQGGEMSRVTGDDSPKPSSRGAPATARLALLQLRHYQT